MSLLCRMVKRFVFILSLSNEYFGTVLPKKGLRRWIKIWAVKVEIRMNF
jgi:hypothetical protein